MTSEELLEIIQLGEDSKHQFKADVTNATSLAAEFVAFSNSKGGTLFIGVSDDGKVVGITQKRIGYVNQLISNSSSQIVHPPINPLTEIIKMDEGLVLLIQVQEGISKPYMDNSGVMWVKSGADKRRVTSREEIQRIFQESNILHGDEMVVRNATFEKIDKPYFKKLYQYIFNEPFLETDVEIPRILKNMNLAGTEVLNIAGALLVAEEPNFLLPAFMVKAVCYPGNDINVDSYIDSEDITGRIETQFKQSIAFISRNIRHIQAGQNVNSVGVLEVSKVALEEIIANALIHRDYFYLSSVRIFIFSDRIEIINPGSLHDNLTIDMMKYGVSCPRNNVLASFANKVLVYRGLGNGVRRALKEHPYITFENDVLANQFKVIIKRTFYNNSDQKLNFETDQKNYNEIDQKNQPKIEYELENNSKLSQNINIIAEKADLIKSTRKNKLKKTDQKKYIRKGRPELLDQEKYVFNNIRVNPKVSRVQLSRELGISESAAKRRLESMVAKSIIKRIGSDKGGYWAIL